MRRIRIYQPGDYQPGNEVVLSEEASRHVALVLRMKPGQSLTLFNGQTNEEFEASILHADKKKLLVKIEALQTVSRESPLAIELIQAVSKGERMPFVIQKAVELGVHCIRPVLSERSVVRLAADRQEKKLAQWQAIAVAACEQCGRNQLPVIMPITSLESALGRLTHPMRLMLNPYADARLPEKPFTATGISLVIGPEGGFSDAEEALLQRHDFQGIQLGPRILRTETAALAAISILQAFYGDL